MNRRAFLSQLSTATACVLPLAVVQPIQRFKVGFLGLSHSHARDKLRIVQEHPAFELVGAFEKSADVRDRYPNVQWLTREQLIASSNSVYVESEVRDHARDTLQALRAGRHVHVEKPASTRYGEMVQMVRIARDKKLLLQSGYMWRYHPGFAAIFEAVHQGWLGKIFQVHGHMTILLDQNRRHEWAEFPGGAFFEQASHLIDALIQLLGRPGKVTPFLRSTQGDALMDNNVAVFEFPKALGIITNSTNQPNASAHRFFEVSGTNGTMLLKPIEAPILEVDLAKAAGPYQAGRQTIPMPSYQRYVGDVEDFARALQPGGKLKFTLDNELLAHEWILRACGMF